MNSPEQIVDRLQLKPHPDGGYYKETYRSSGGIDNAGLEEGYEGDRNYSTCIYFLLTSDSFSLFHRIRQDEIWHFYDGSPINLHTISPNGQHTEHIIGRAFDKGQVPQLVVSGGDWFVTEVMEEGAYSLVGCTVSPGFNFEDLVLADRQDLISKFPIHQGLITRFTR